MARKLINLNAGYRTLSQLSPLENRLSPWNFYIDDMFTSLRNFIALTTVIEIEGKQFNS